MGIFAIFLSTVFSTSKDILSKKLAVRIDGTASTFASFGFALPFYLLVLAVLWFMGHDIFTFSAAFWMLVLLRALTDVFAEGMKMYSFAHGDISLVNIIFSFSPLCVLALTPLLKNDKLSLGGVLAVVLVVFGSVALVYRPSHPDWAKQKAAMMLAVGAALFFGLNSIFDKLAMEPEMSAVEGAGNPTSGAALIVKPAVGGFAMTAVSAAALLPFVLLRKDRVEGLAIYRRELALRGLLEVAFMVCKLVAMQDTDLPAAFVVGLQRSSLLLSIIAGRMIFNEGDFRRRMLAGTLILAGVVWILYEQSK